MNKVIVVELFGSNGQRGIVYNRSKSLAAAIEGGNITTDYLEAGARLTGSVGSTVPGTVACLISTATAESFYIGRRSTSQMDSSLRCLLLHPQWPAWQDPVWNGW